MTYERPKHPSIGHYEGIRDELTAPSEPEDEPLDEDDENQDIEDEDEGI